MEEMVLVVSRLKHNIRLFEQRLEANAKSCQVFGQSAGSNDRQIPDMGLALPPLNIEQDTGLHTPGDCKPSNGNKGSEAAVIYLYHTRREKRVKHKLKNCKVCPEDQKVAIPKKQVDKKNKSKKAQSVRAKTKNGKQSSVTINVVFVRGHRTQLCVDSGGDGNIMGDQILQGILIVEVDTVVNELHQPQVFDIAGSNSNGKEPSKYL